ncbi:MAG: cytochrome P450 [Gammaproteobacteria bacterium]|nr:cytochrome P450 [Gammaproteobacteria bacterium]
MTTPSPLAKTDPWQLPLASLDPSHPDLYQYELHGPLFARLRRESPVHYTADSPFGSFWSITRHADIAQVELNHEVFSNSPAIVIGDPPTDFAPPMFIQMDPPRHSEERAAVLPAVSAARMKELEVLIRSRVGAILDGLPVGETFNWVDHVSRELTTQMLATLFDFPWEDRHLLPFWSDATTTSDLVGADTDEAERRRVLGECLAYFARLWQERASATEPRFDFISLLAHNPKTRDMINDPMELLGNLMLLIVGGNDTTRNSISGGVLAMHRHPGQLEALRADRSLIPNAVSEIIRWQTPVAHMRRTAKRDFSFQGQDIRAGDKVVMWYASANRDEAVFEDAGRFDITRRNAREHLSFGHGIHRCLGSRVAEMQLRILWDEILNRYTRIEVVGEPQRFQSNFLQGYTELLVNVVPL